MQRKLKNSIEIHHNGSMYILKRVFKAKAILQLHKKNKLLIKIFNKLFQISALSAYILFGPV